MAENAYPYDTAIVRELLKNKRKTRGIRSCFPCRHRKVRCDGREPCSNCIKRGHSELCRVPTASGSEARVPQPALRDVQGPSELNLDAVTIEEAQSQSSTDPSLLISKLEKIEEQISSLKADLRATVTATSQSPHPVSEARNNGQSRTKPASKSPGRYFVEDATGATIYLGSHSDTPLALGCRRASAAGDTMLHDALIDQFVPRAYPFTNLWGAEATAKDVCETLPDDSDIIRYWQVYQSIVYPFYPSLVTIDEFGPALFAFLDERVAAEEATTEDFGPDSSWLALLFAVLACGVQFSDDPIKERDLRSKVLSSTIRLAQSIGLHEASPSLPESEQFQRNRLWWTIVWQDTFLSFTYDRPPSTITMSCPIPYRQQTGGLSFQESIFTICNILLNKARQETAGNLEDAQQSALRPGARRYKRI
ncbi:hypothetical protein APSETT444_004468 [Aspergillus pseudonomiae]